MNINFMLLIYMEDYGIVGQLCTKFLVNGIKKVISLRIQNGQSLMDKETKIKELIVSKPSKKGIAITKLETINIIKEFEAIRGKESINSFAEYITNNALRDFDAFMTKLNKTGLVQNYENELDSLITFLEGEDSDQHNIMDFSLIESRLDSPKNIAPSAEFNSIAPEANNNNTKGKECDKLNPLNKVKKFMRVSNGLVYEVTCSQCKGLHQITYSSKLDDSNQAYSKLNLYMNIFKSKCSICKRFEKSWTKKVVLHEKFTEKCILCADCLKKYLRSQTNEMAVSKGKVRTFQCRCNALLTNAGDSICALLDNESSQHLWVLQQKIPTMLLCILCGDLIKAEYNI